MIECLKEHNNYDKLQYFTNSFSDMLERIFHSSSIIPFMRIQKPYFHIWNYYSISKKAVFNTLYAVFPVNEHDIERSLILSKK